MGLYRFLVASLLLSLINIAVVGVHASTDEDAISRQRRFEYFYMQALSMKEQGDMAAAFDMLEHCRAICPYSPSLLYDLAPFYSYLERKDEAIGLLKLAIEREPDNFWYYQMLATFYEENSLLDDAIALYDAMTERFSSHSEVYIYLAGLYDETGNYHKAISTLDKLEKVEGKSEVLSQQKFRLYMLLQDKENSIRELQELSNEYPDDLRYRVSLGDTYLRFGDNETAFSIYMDVLAEDPKHLQAQSSLIDYYAVNEDYEMYTKSMEALLVNEKLDTELRIRNLVDYVKNKPVCDSVGYCVELFEKLMLLPFDRAEIADVYASFLVAKDFPEERVTPVLKRLLRLEPENYLAQMQMLRYAIERSDFEDIVVRCDTAILYNPEILALYYYRGIACYNLARRSEAVATFREGLAKCAEETELGLISDVFALLGDTEHELGHTQACYEAYDSALVYDSENITVLNNYAYFLSLESRDLERALEMSYKTIQAKPDEPTYIDTYAWILFGLERYEESKAYAEKLILLSKDEELSAVLCVHIGDIYAKCGDMDKALEYWNKARQMGDESKILKRKIKKRKYIADGKN